MTNIKDAIATNMAALGSPVLAKESIYDWADPWAINHILGVNPSTYEMIESNSCSWINPKDPDLEEIFVTSFGDPYGDSETEKMIQIKHFSCACGKFQDVTIRFAGEHSDFLIALMENQEG
jgi:hypothetical protein